MESCELALDWHWGAKFVLISVKVCMWGKNNARHRVHQQFFSTLEILHKNCRFVLLQFMCKNACFDYRH
ncbi:MAG: hypothetical protein GY820_29860 [Gammaproteobacteria bacterium]|nr:hypothetical protein [Gammaproteobacteria bacterium]